MRRILEFFKTLLIIVLICSLVLLAIATVPTKHIRSISWLSTLLQPVAPLLGLPQSELTYVKVDLPVMDSAQPVAVSIRNSMGRWSSQWNFQSLDDTFEALGGTLGQALDTAKTFRAATQQQLEAALSGPSLYFSYDVTLPASLLASWLDASMPENAPSAHTFVLALEEAEVRLYLAGETVFVSSTAISEAAFSRLLEQYDPDGSFFAFENGYAQSPLSLLQEDIPTMPGAIVRNPCDARFVEQLATSFGFNPYGDTNYTDSTGTTHFTEANCALQITESGIMTLTSTDEGRFLAADDSIQSLVEEARYLAELATGGNTGDSRLYLSELTQDGPVTVCSFDYYYAGLPVQVGGEHAATITFQGNCATHITMVICSMTETAERTTLLPAAQAAAIVPQDQPLVLRYHAANGSLTVGWSMDP